MKNKNIDNEKNISEEKSISFEMLKMFYNRPTPLKDDSGQPFIAPHDGSLGLLALGHIGLIEWRKSRERYMLEKNKKTVRDQTEQEKS